MRTVVFNDTSIDDHHGCQLVMRRIAALSQKTGLDVILSCPLGYDWSSDEALKKSISTAEICLINGEGTMHDDAPAALKLGELAKYCHDHQVPCFLINSVWQNNERLNDYARFFTRIYVRDRLSQGELLDIGVNSEVVPDLTLSLDNKTVSYKPRKGFVFNGSVLPHRIDEAWFEVRQSRKRIQYLSIRTLPCPPAKAYDLTRKIYKRKRMKMLRHYAFSFFRRYSERLSKKGRSRLRWRYAVLSTDEFLQRLQQAEGVVTGRFHMVTLCLITKTPFYAMTSNTFKIEGLLQEVGMQKRILNSYREAFNSLSDIKFTSAELKEIDRFIEDAKRKATAMFMDIKRVASERRV